jgi:spore coat protein CotH
MKVFKKWLIGLILFSLLCSLDIFPGYAEEKDSYETFFDSSHVHSIDISMTDWEGFLRSASKEEYGACDVTIDGETVCGVGIRAKGNGSLLAVSRMGSPRYSWKIEFDHFVKKQFFHGLDKLCLNNFMQDATFMKETIVYSAMAAMDVPAPLCSYAFVTVNGEDFGLYQMVEAIEDSFLSRNFGGKEGKLYKPDSINVVGFIQEDFHPLQMMGELLKHVDLTAVLSTDWSKFRGMANGDFTQMYGDGSSFVAEENNPLAALFPNITGVSDDLLLKYVDDRPESYPNIFENAKSKVKEKDELRLIAALKRLNAREDLEHTVSTDEVIRYFAVHNLFVNSDSYTGMSGHNYHLYERGGVLSMLPWDYNLAFGTMMMKPEYAVNDPIDEPMAVKSDGNHPMFEWITADPAYRQKYYSALEQTMACLDYPVLIEETDKMIAPYVERDPTKFVTFEKYQESLTMLKMYLGRRLESVKGQIAGAIPSCKAGQKQFPEAAVSFEEIDLHLLGDVTMGMIPDNE